MKIGDKHLWLVFTSYSIVSIRKTMLSGAYYILKYILGKVSTNRQHDLVDDMRRAFDNVEFEIVKKIICDNSGFDINSL